ncbi:hypothetical protein [Paenibacillus stellifer]|uniref:hypothetical protein n=1 Tax=Paenibacillus stellifer TaxID=169760 RepID=UPI00316AE0F8
MANYDDPYNGGILSSIRFGSQAEIDYARWYSIGFQMVAFIILLLHSVYASIFYLFNPKERALFYFGLLTLTVGVAIVSGHDNLLMLWSSGYPKILSGSSEEPGAARIHSRTSVLLGVSAGLTGFNGL